MTGSENTGRSDVLAALRQATRIGVTSHVRPDGDAIGSAAGLVQLLNDNGMQATLAGVADVPERYAFLRGALPLAHTSGDYDLLVVLDTGDLSRAEPFVEQWKGPLINIDHHPTNTHFGGINLVDATAGATAQIIIELAVDAGWTISRQAAEALWTGLVTDTGRFAYSCTTANTLQAAAHLLPTGLDSSALDHRLFNTLRLPAMRLQALAISRMQLESDNKLALIILSADDFAACGAIGADAEDIVTLPRQLDSVQVSAFLYQTPDTADGSVKLSLRTQPPHDAARFCQRLGGGGHARAAGCTLAIPIDKAYSWMREEIRNGFGL